MQRPPALLVHLVLPDRQSLVDPAPGVLVEAPAVTICQRRAGINPEAGSGRAGTAPRGGLGVGGGLVDTGIRHCVDRRVQRLEIVTQARNTGSQSLYQKFGFRTQRAQLWYHKWFEEEAG